MYLGLLLAEEGRKGEGAREIEAGLKGILDWQAAMAGPYRSVWDPGLTLARAAVETLDLLKAEAIDWEQVRKNIVWLVDNYDEETEAARRQLQRRRHPWFIR
jgi:hypothetical protein